MNLRCRAYQLRTGLSIEGDFRDLRATIDLSMADFAAEEFAEHFRQYLKPFGQESYVILPLVSSSCLVCITIHLNNGVGLTHVGSSSEWWAATVVTYWGYC